MTILEELETIGAVPLNVRDAAMSVQSQLDAELTPSRENVNYIECWVNHMRGNNRYGK